MSFNLLQSRQKGRSGLCLGLFINLNIGKLFHFKLELALMKNQHIFFSFNHITFIHNIIIFH